MLRSNLFFIADMFDAGSSDCFMHLFMHVCTSVNTCSMKIYSKKLYSTALHPSPLRCAGQAWRLIVVLRMITLALTFIELYNNFCQYFLGEYTYKKSLIMGNHGEIPMLFFYVI